MYLLPLLSALLSDAHAGGLMLQGVIAGSWGWEHPALIVGFNPQPEPPGDRGLCADLSSARAPVVDLEGVEDGYLELLLGLAIAESEVSVRSIYLPGDACRSRTDTVLWPSEGDVALPPGPCAEGNLALIALLSDGTELPIQVDIQGDSRTAPAKISAFKTGEDIAGVPAAVALGVTFDSSRTSTASVEVSITDPRSGETIALQ